MLGPEMVCSPIGKIDHHRLIHTGVAGIVTASLSDRVGRRPILLTCTTLLMIGSFLCGCATSYWAQTWAVCWPKRPQKLCNKLVALQLAAKLKLEDGLQAMATMFASKICLFSSDCLCHTISYYQPVFQAFFGVHTTKELRTSLQRECFRAWVRRWSRWSLPWPERSTCNWSWNSSGSWFWSKDQVEKSWKDTCKQCKL